jgi:bifunctional lysine-specific demethylase and histidyl-hydroxylase NO66
MLEQLVSKPEEFMDRHWGRQLWLSRGGELVSPRPLVSVQEVMQLLDSQALRPPYIRVVRSGGGTAPPKTWTEPGMVGGQPVIDKLRWSGVLAEFRQGSTLVFDDFQDQCSTVRTICSCLSEELQVPFRAHLFITPPGRQGLQLHFDDKEVFVLQIAGAKNWTVHDQQIPVPRRSGVIEDDLDGSSPAQFRLAAGDCLYIPAGSPHMAAAVDDALSIHVSFGGKPLYWAAMIEGLVRQALRTTGFAGTTGSGGVGREQYLKELRPRLQDFGKTLIDLLTEENLDAVIAGHWQWAVPDSSIRSVIGDVALVSEQDVADAVVQLAHGAQIASDAIDERMTITVGNQRLHVTKDLGPALELLADSSVPMTAVVEAVGPERARKLVTGLVNQGALQVVSPAKRGPTEI